MEYLWLSLLGIGVGAFGTIVGAGGGFILMPILLLAYPAQSPAALTAGSLVVVLCNATSGSWSYAHMKRIDFRSGMLFLVTAIPGALAGAILINHIPRRPFNLTFGIFLLVGAAFIFWRTFRNVNPKLRRGAKFHRELTDADGVRHVWAYNLPLGMTLAFLVGLASSMLGIGGGIIHVPAMVGLLDFPIHLATATSHFILAITALVGTVVHLCDGSLRAMGPAFLFVAGGAVIGAQIGAAVSKRVHGKWIMRGLAVALAIVGVRILVQAISVMLS